VIPVSEGRGFPALSRLSNSRDFIDSIPIKHGRRNNAPTICDILLESNRAQRAVPLQMDLYGLPRWGLVAHPLGWDFWILGLLFHVKQ